MFLHFRSFSRNALLVCACLLPGSHLLAAQDSSFQAYGPKLGVKMEPTVSNPFLGAWLVRMPGPGGTGSLMSIIEYLPNGTFRSETTIEGGFMNRAKIQLWGNYGIQRVDSKHFILGAKAVGITPKEFCIKAGDCKPNDLPEVAEETDEMVDSDHFHSIFTSQGVKTEADAYRSYLPIDFGRVLEESVMLPVPQAGPPTPAPDRRHIGLDDGPGSCDNLQQQRICIVNNGRMVKDQRGCQVCRPLEEPDPKPDSAPKPSPPGR